MEKCDRFRLLFGPYQTPAFEYGQPMFCEMQGEVIVGGLSNARIPWPTATSHVGGPRRLIVMGDLVRALRWESAQAVGYWWGVCTGVVTRWRKQLGVELCNAGTYELRRQYGQTPECLESLKRALTKSLEPESLAKRGESHRGMGHTEEARRKIGEKSRGRKPSDETRRKLSLAHTGRPNPGVKNRWTPEEDALLATLPVKDVIKLTGRTRASCEGRKRWLALVAVEQPLSTAGVDALRAQAAPAIQQS